MEALIVGLPVVSTNVGGVGEIVDDAANGFLVDADDLEGMALKVKLLIENSDLRSKLSKHAVEKAKESDWENVKNKWYNILHEATS